MSASAAYASDSALKSEEDHFRAQIYLLIASLLARPPGGEMLTVVRQLQGDDSDLGKAFHSLAANGDKFSEEQLRHEFNDLFIGMGRGELVPFGSYYLTGFLNEKPLAKLRNAMRELNITRADEVKEPEDNIASVMEMMAGLITGAFGSQASDATQKEFFDQHIGSWAPHFFKDLETAESAKFYKPVGRIGQLFMEIERAAFDME